MTRRQVEENRLGVSAKVNVLAISADGIKRPPQGHANEPFEIDLELGGSIDAAFPAPIFGGSGVSPPTGCGAFLKKFSLRTSALVRSKPHPRGRGLSVCQRYRRLITLGVQVSAYGLSNA